MRGMPAGLTIACGPFFSEEGLHLSLFVLLVVKPLTYFAFIQAFRFRVSRGTPMSTHRAACLAGVRTLAGAALVASMYGMLSVTGAGEWVSWSALMAERALVWLAIGWWLAGLRGRRLAGWTLSGAAIDGAYDATIGASVIGGGWLPHVGVAGAVAILITGLTLVGRRRSLRARFARPGICSQCDYDLAGSVSGVCPECGTRARAA